MRKIVGQGGLMGLVLAVFFVACGAQAPEIVDAPAVSEEDTRIVVGERVGGITPESSAADLMALYGEDQVKTADVYVGEGYSEPGTVVFPEDPTRTVEILWHDAQAQARPQTVWIRTEKTVWRTPDGITLGTTLKELEKLNGGPFKLLGFGWDYAGGVTSWQSGALAEKLIKPQGRLMVRLFEDAPPEYTETYAEEVGQVSGDQEFSSDHPMMQKLNPKVGQLILQFEAPAKPPTP